MSDWTDQTVPVPSSISSPSLSSRRLLGGRFLSLNSSNHSKNPTSSIHIHLLIFLPFFSIKSNSCVSLFFPLSLPALFLSNPSVQHPNVVQQPCIAPRWSPHWRRALYVRSCASDRSADRHVVPAPGHAHDRRTRWIVRPDVRPGAGASSGSSVSDADDADGDYASSGEFVTSIALFVVVFRSNTFVTHAFSTYLILHSIDSLLINDICV